MSAYTTYILFKLFKELNLNYPQIGQEKSKINYLSDKNQIGDDKSIIDCGMSVTIVVCNLYKFVINYLIYKKRYIYSGFNLEVPRDGVIDRNLVVNTLLHNEQNIGIRILYFKNLIAYYLKNDLNITIPSNNYGYWCFEFDNHETISEDNIRDLWIDSEPLPTRNTESKNSESKKKYILFSLEKKIINLALDCVIKILLSKKYLKNLKKI